MTKRITAKHKIDRRLSVNLWGRPKSPFNLRKYRPGQHGQKHAGKISDYGSWSILHDIDNQEPISFGGIIPFGWSKL